MIRSSCSRMTVNEGLSAGFSFQHCCISSYLRKCVTGVNYEFMKDHFEKKTEGLHFI